MLRTLYFVQMPWLEFRTLASKSIGIWYVVRAIWLWGDVTLRRLKYFNEALPPSILGRAFLPFQFFAAFYLKWPVALYDSDAAPSGFCVFLQTHRDGNIIKKNWSAIPIEARQSTAQLPSWICSYVGITHVRKTMRFAFITLHLTEMSKKYSVKIFERTISAF